ncbi:MAG: PAS domain-containing protein [Anaerolineae bacterium]|nr:PAS domain-containing protein [Anaerolineae bacterium]
MPGQLVLYIGVLAVAALGAILLASFVWRRRMVAGAVPFALSMYALAAWSVTVILTHLSDELPAKLFWTNAQYVGITLAPLMWLLFVLRYTGHGSIITRRNLRLLALHPALVQIAVWTNPHHHLFRKQVWLDTGGGVPMLGTTLGPAFWIHATYTYALMLMSAYFLIRSHFFAPRVYRRQGWTLLIAIAVPWLANIVTITQPARLSYLDLTPFAFIVSGVAIVWGLARNSLLDLAPAAREAVMENMTTGIVVLDQQDRVVDINSAAESMLSVSSKRILGQQLSKVLPHYSYMMSRFRGVGPARDEVTLGEGPSQRIYDLRVSPLRDSRADVIGHLVNIQDITQRKHAELALSRYADRLRILYEIDQAILAAKSAETIALAVLDQIQYLLPCTRMSVVSLDGSRQPHMLAVRGSAALAPERAPWVETLAVDDFGGFELRCVNDVPHDAAGSALDLQLYDEGVRAYMTVPLMAQDMLVGTLNLEHTVDRAFTSEHFDVASQIAASLAVALETARLFASAQQELSERKMAEAALRESETTLRQRAEDLVGRNAELDAFAHTVAHDLKTPLSLLTGYTSFMEAQDIATEPQDLAMCVRAIGQSARKMGSIIDELLLLASVRKVDEVAPTPLDTEAIVFDVLQRLADLTESHNADIVLPDIWPIAWGYAPWVEEVWANYLSNAIKYGGSPPRVELGATVTSIDGNGDDVPRVIRFWVKDNGDGLSEAQRARLFIPFERLEQVRAKGYGLGLSIVQRIMEKLGGAWGVESTGCSGEGSLFYFELLEADI